jgi:hypothetical protein
MECLVHIEDFAQTSQFEETDDRGRVCQNPETAAGIFEPLPVGEQHVKTRRIHECHLAEVEDDSALKRLDCPIHVWNCCEVDFACDYDLSFAGINLV